jgi:hypothetical protein
LSAFASTAATPESRSSTTPIPTRPAPQRWRCSTATAAASGENCIGRTRQVRTWSCSPAPSMASPSTSLPAGKRSPTSPHWKPFAAQRRKTSRWLSRPQREPLAVLCAFGHCVQQWPLRPRGLQHGSIATNHRRSSTALANHMQPFGWASHHHSRACCRGRGIPRGLSLHCARRRRRGRPAKAIGRQT